MSNTEMQSTGKKLHRSVSGKSYFSKRDIGSKINTSFQNKNSCKLSCSKRSKPKPRSHTKTISSVLPKRKTPEFSSKGIRNNSQVGKSVRRKIPQMASDSNSSEKPLSSMLRGRKSSILSCKRHEKNTNGDVETQKLYKRRKRRKRRKNGELDEASRLQRRTRYLVIKMKLEQNLIDAYSGEGWRGQSREKIKPEKELQRAKKQILKCKLGIRDAIRQLEFLSSEGCIEDSVIGPDGSVFHEHIFCAKCKLRDAFPDNDIILCDGSCNCAFHQKCLEPPLATENIPPGDQGWFCRFCECKMEILEGINAHLGTQFSTNSIWQDIFKEAAAVPDCENASLNPEDEWPSDDSEDDDYDPERNEKSFSCSRTSTEDNMSDNASSSAGLFWTSEEVNLQSGRLGNDGIMKGGSCLGRNGYMDSDEIKFAGLINSIDSDDATDRITNRRRQRRDVDYKKLHDEMFGKDVPENEQVSEDEDWGPRRRKRRGNESDAAGTLVALRGIGNGCSNVIPIEDGRNLPSVSEDKRTLSRIPPNAVEKLRRAFAENELPSRAVRENLSKKLGLTSEKVNKWFKNARYTALKIRKAESTKQLHRNTGIAKVSSGATGKTQSADQTASKGNSCLVPSTTGAQISKNLKKVRRRRNPKSITSPSKKKLHKRAAGALLTNIDEVSVWLSKAMGLKKQMSNFKRKAALEKVVNPKCEIGTSKSKEQLYLAEMGRLCHLGGKLDKLKEVLSRICNTTTTKNHVSDEIHLDERHVIYVPVAEVREKCNFA